MSRWNGINGITSHVAYLNDGSVVSVRWRSSFDSQSTMKHTPSGPMYTPPPRTLPSRSIAPRSSSVSWEAWRKSAVGSAVPSIRPVTRKSTPGHYSGATYPDARAPTPVGERGVELAVDARRGPVVLARGRHRPRRLVVPQARGGRARRGRRPRRATPVCASATSSSSAGGISARRRRGPSSRSGCAPR